MGTPRPVAPQIPKKQRAEALPQLLREVRGRKGRGKGWSCSFLLLQQLGQGRVPRVFPRKEVRAGQPPALGGPTSSQPPTPCSCPYKAAVVTEARKEKKKKKRNVTNPKAIKSCVSITCPAPGSLPRQDLAASPARPQGSHPGGLASGSSKFMGPQL